MTKLILIVEDEPILQEMYQQRFEQAGFKVITANDGEEGLEQTRKLKPDLILLDILMPKKNGLDLLKNIRQESEIAQTKVVAFSNFDDQKSKDAATELGVVEYLIKTNYTPTEVVEEIKKQLA